MIREVPRKRRSKHQPLVKTELGGSKVLKTTVALVKKAYEVRHDTVHNTGAAHRVSDHETREIANAAWQFCTFLGMHLEGTFDKLWRRR